MPHSSLFGRDFSDFWICIETGQTVRDSQSGFRAYPVAPVLDLKIEAQHYNFEMEVLTKALWAGLRVSSIPIQVFYPERSQQVSSFKPFLDNARISRTHTRLVLRAFLPLPHEQLIEPQDQSPTTVKSIFHAWQGENASPLGLATAAGLTVLPGIALWPWGAIVALFVAVRLHLNKFMTLGVLAFCMAPVVPHLSQKLGRALFADRFSPGIQTFIAAHLIAFPVAVCLALLVYISAKRYRSTHS